MAAYFIRRLASGGIAVLAMTFVLYSMLMYLPGGLLWQAEKLGEGWGWKHYSYQSDNYLGTASFKLRRPWPDSYLALRLDRYFD